MDVKQVQTPFTDEMIKKLHAGDVVELSGTIYSGRDAAHKRLCDLLDKGEELPVNLADEAIYFFGPSPTRPDQVIGSAGPTTSYRMDAYSPMLMERVGLKAMIGKGGRSESVINSMKANCCVYFAAIGGAAALIAESIKKDKIVCYEDLGPEAIHKLEIDRMPLVVAIDCYGEDLYKKGKEQYYERE